ncbi:basic region leucine zipper [Dictyocaulus viviparus]|uniref:Basic region leucine zipper n=1 Tax=Dictyocaulus viviparus TaxID=29172 RepID=A0A0D8Y445_DICVI|nr:basic region leucine zipper [Dictyocaulus viviparus]
MTGRKRINVRPASIERNEEYIEKRRRNNEAVNRTREKKRLEESETAKRVEELREENEKLERQKRGFSLYLDLKVSNIKILKGLILASGMIDEVESTKFFRIVDECVETSAEAIEAVGKLVSALKTFDDELEGISLLDVKNRELLSYMADLAILMSQMSCGRAIKDHPSVLRACKHRTVCFLINFCIILDKIRPIEQKMSSQVDRLLQRIHNCEMKEPSRAKPDQMERMRTAINLNGRKKKYVPPKIMAVKYEEDDDSKEAKTLKKARRRAIQSSLVQELRQQYGDAPEEFKEQSGRKYKSDKERENYEEDNYVRLRMGKAQKKRERLLTRDNAVNDLFKFGDYMLRDESGEALSHSKRRKISEIDGSRRKKSRFERKMEKKKKLKTKNKVLKRKR